MIEQFSNQTIATIGLASPRLARRLSTRTSQNERGDLSMQYVLITAAVLSFAVGVAAIFGPKLFSSARNIDPSTTFPTQ